MEIEFIIDNKVVLKRNITEKIQINHNPNSFSIPIINSPEQEQSFTPKKNLLSKKTNRSNSNSSDEEEEDESEEYEENENSYDDENDSEDSDNENNQNFSPKNNNKNLGDSFSSSSKNNSNQRRLRKYGAISEKENELLGFGNNKKIVKELTEEEIAKKTEQARLRKLHAKKLIEEEKREAVERILNEDGRKLRERNKKLNEEIKKKTQIEEERKNNNLTKIITKYLSNGKMYVRFPQGFLLPSVLFQQKKEIKEIPKCHVEGCENLRKYTDPKTGFPYCSVKCFKVLRNNIGEMNK